LRESAAEVLLDAGWTLVVTLTNQNPKIETKILPILHALAAPLLPGWVFYTGRPRTCQGTSFSTLDKSVHHHPPGLMD
jgi:hypothetical protein